MRWYIKSPTEPGVWHQPLLTSLYLVCTHKCQRQEAAIVIFFLWNIQRLNQHLEQQEYSAQSINLCLKLTVWARQPINMVCSHITLTVTVTESNISIFLHQLMLQVDAIVDSDFAPPSPLLTLTQYF